MDKNNFFVCFYIDFFGGEGPGGSYRLEKSGKSAKKKGLRKLRERPMRY